MKYFKNINTFEQAKLQYRKLAKLLHPDRGSSPANFQQMQTEYKSLLLKLQNNEFVNNQSENGNEILNELGNLANVLIKRQVPQAFLKLRISKSKTSLERGIYSGLIKFFDEYSS